MYAESYYPVESLYFTQHHPENKMIHMQHEKISLTPAVTVSVMGIASLRQSRHA